MSINRARSNAPRTFLSEIQPNDRIAEVLARTEDKDAVQSQADMSGAENRSIIGKEKTQIPTCSLLDDIDEWDENDGTTGTLLSKTVGSVGSSVLPSNGSVHHLLLGGSSPPTCSLRSVQSTQKSSSVRKSGQRMVESKKNMAGNMKKSEIIAKLLEEEGEVNNHLEEQVATCNNNTMYADDDVRIMLSVIKERGYRNRRKQKQSISDLFEDVIVIARKKYGIQKTATSWKSKWRRLKRDYDQYCDKIKESGQHGDDDDLYDKPAFFTEIHELCHESARHTTPAASCSEIAHEKKLLDKSFTSTKKKVASAEKNKMQSDIQVIERQHTELMEAFEKDLKQKERLIDVISKVAESLMEDDK